MRSLKQLDLILRGDVLKAKPGEKILDFALGPIVSLNIILAAVYGVCMGTFAVLGRDEPEWRQVFASATKVPLLFMITLVVTLPSLYVFSALLGTALRPLQLLRVVAAGMSVLLAVLAAFGPIVAFFSVSTTSYPFILLLNVLVFGVSGAFGMVYLHKAVRKAIEVNEPEPEFVASQEGGEGAPVIPVARPIHLHKPQGQGTGIFLVWIVLFGIVGAQSGWILRPFVGSPEVPFTWFRPKQGSFFEGLGNSMERLIGVKATDRRSQ